MNQKVIIIGAGVSGLSTAALLTKEEISVHIYEKSSKVGGRTSSMTYKNHILDNGFHIMPFYKKSAVYEILKEVGIISQLKLAKVFDIAFFQDKKFFRYPKGITDILKMSIVPFRSRIQLLRTLTPMAFSSIKKSEELDNTPLTRIMEKFDEHTRKFFDAVCMLAFADVPEHVSLGEFVRTIIRANPFKGGTSEFAYPSDGGYDQISKLLSSYLQKNGVKIELNNSIKKIVVENCKVKGIITKDDEFVASNCVVVSHPAYLAINQLFDKDVFEKSFVDKVNRLNKTTSVVEVHFCLSKQIDTRQVVFPVGKDIAAKGIFFITNITSSVSPPGEHLIMSGTPVESQVVDNPAEIKRIIEKMKVEISEIYPDFQESLLWEKPMAWKLVEAVVKEPGLVWKQKMPHQIPEIEGLFFIGDSTVSYGIGTDSAAHSSILCHPKIMSYLKQTRLLLAQRFGLDAKFLRI